MDEFQRKMERKQVLRQRFTKFTFVFDSVCGYMYIFLRPFAVVLSARLKLSYLKVEVGQGQVQCSSFISLPACKHCCTQTNRTDRLAEEINTHTVVLCARNMFFHTQNVQCTLRIECTLLSSFKPDN